MIIDQIIAPWIIVCLTVAFCTMSACAVAIVSIIVRGKG